MVSFLHMGRTACCLVLGISGLAGGIYRDDLFPTAREDGRKTALEHPYSHCAGIVFAQSGVFSAIQLTPDLVVTAGHCLLLPGAASGLFVSGARFNELTAPPTALWTVISQQVCAHCPPTPAASST